MVLIVPAQREEVVQTTNTTRSARYSRLFKNVIMDTMAEYDISPDMATGKMRKWTQYFTGCFTCKDCNNSWSSNWCWVVVDLRDQEIKYRFHQKCRECLTPKLPFLTVEEAEVVMRKICIRFWKRWYDPEPPTSRRNSFSDSSGDEDPAELPRSRKTHRPSLCEKCGYDDRNPPCYELYKHMTKKLEKAYNDRVASTEDESALTSQGL